MKKLLAILIALCLIAACFPLAASADSAPAIALGANKLTTGSRVWFAGYNKAPVSWLVMGAGSDGGGNSRLLLTEYVIDMIKFNSTDNATWQESLAQKWCAELYSTFSAAEQAAALPTSKSDAAYRGKSLHFGTSSLVNEHVFLLSAPEAEEIYFPRGDDSSRIAYNIKGVEQFWWLRSPYATHNTSAAVVTTLGEVNCYPAGHSHGARPALNLDLSSIVFVSPASGGKPAGETGLAEIGAVSENNKDWKLTLRDPGRSFSASAASVKGPAGGTVRIPYAHAETGANEYISALLSVGDALYYGSVKAAASGTAEFTLPADLADGSYTLRVFNEQKNPDKYSDAASAFAEVALTVGPADPDEPEEPSLPETFADATGSYAIDISGGATYQKPAGSGASAKIPDTITVNGQTVPVTKIADNAFKANKKLTKVTLGKNIKEIGKNAFANCAKLKSVSGGTNVEVIGDSAFSGCKALKSFTIGAKVNKIGKKAFYKCAALKKITIKSVFLTKSTVGSGAFKGIHPKATIKVPKAVKKDYTKWLLKKGVKKTMKIK